MTDDELNQHAEDLSKFLVERDLGGVCFIVSKENLANVIILPKWGILQFSKNNKNTFSIDRGTAKNVMQWLEKAELTAFFLEAVMKATVQTNKMFHKVVATLEELFAQATQYIEENPNSENKTLH